MFQQYFFNNEDFMIYHLNICGFTNKTKEIVTSFVRKISSNYMLCGTSFEIYANSTNICREL